MTKANAIKILAEYLDTTRPEAFKYFEISSIDAHELFSALLDIPFNRPE